MKFFHFHVNKFTPKENFGHYHCMVLRSKGVDADAAYNRIVEQIPDGHRIWCWYEDETIEEEVMFNNTMDSEYDDYFNQ